MSDERDVLEIEERGPAAGRRDVVGPVKELEDIRYFDPRQFRSPEERQRPFRTGVVVGGLFALWVFFAAFGLVLFGSLLAGTVMWLICLLGWLVIIGSRGWWMSESSPFEILWNMVMRDEVEPPKVDEAPAQLLRKRGNSDGALAMYRGWSEEHHDLAILLYRMAEILHHDLKDIARARSRYEEFVERVERKGSSATEEERTMAGYARLVLKDLKSRKRAPPERP